MYFKVKMTTSMAKLKKHYAERQVRVFNVHENSCLVIFMHAICCCIKLNDGFRVLLSIHFACSSMDADWLMKIRLKKFVLAFVFGVITNVQIEQKQCSHACCLAAGNE